jgi:hypothetical protein
MHCVLYLICHVNILIKTLNKECQWRLQSGANHLQIDKVNDTYLKRPYSVIYLMHEPLKI